MSIKNSVAEDLVDVYNALTPSQIETADLDGMAFTVRMAMHEIESLTAENQRLGMEFQPINTAPIGKNAYDQILCRFKNTQFNYWVYMIAYPNGASTLVPGYSPPEEWCELSTNN